MMRKDAATNSLPVKPAATTYTAMVCTTPLAEISFPEIAARITAITITPNIGLLRPYTSASPYAFSSFAKSTPATSAAKKASTYPFTFDWLTAAHRIIAAATMSGASFPNFPKRNSILFPLCSIPTLLFSSPSARSWV